ncbi:DNA polymerase Y family protein [Streptomyces sp. NPDC000878]
MGDRHILHLRFVLPPGHDPDLLEQLHRLLQDVTPRVQMLPPDSAVLDLTGSLRFWNRDARGITDLIQLRAAAFFGVSSSAAAAPNPMLAAMAAALTPPGRRTVIDDTPEAIVLFLRPRPVRHLPGASTATAATLTEYGLHTVGDLADAPALALQRLLGARTGRTLHERAHGRDTTVVDPAPVPTGISAEHRFPHDELDPAQHRRALLALADDLGTRLRADGQITSSLTCTVRYADQTSTRRSRTLPPPRGHPAHRPPGPYRVRDIRVPWPATRPGPEHRPAGRRPETRSSRRPAAHPRRRRGQAPRDRIRRRPRPHPLRPQHALPRRPRDRRAHRRTSPAATSPDD